MQRATLERHQVWLYLGAVVLGVVAGTARPTAAERVDVALMPALALLMYATFVQVPLAALPAALRDRRFLAALLLGNFVFLPVVVLALLPLVPGDPALRLGLVLVLVVPCTDWFVTFTHLGRGDAGRAIAVTPLLMLAQLVTLPAYLWLLLPSGGLDVWVGGELIEVLVLVIGLPLLLAAATQRWLEADASGRPWAERLAWTPVPLLALVVLLIAASQASFLPAMQASLAWVVLAFLAFAMAAVALGVALGCLFRLPVGPRRTLVFSFATRNSFVVLPIALALPAGLDAAALVIVLQSLVELLVLVALVRLVPTSLVPDPLLARS